MPDYEYMLQRLKERKGYLIGIEKESVEYKINKIEGIVKGLDYQFMITTTKLVSRGRLIEKINKEKNFIKGYKKLLMCDNTFLGYIEDRLQFNRIKVMLYEKELPYYNEKNEEIEGLDEYLDEYLREDSESGGIREGGIREGIRPYTDSSSLGTNGLSDFYKNNHNVNHNHDHLPRSCDPHSNDYPPNPTTNPPNPTNNPPKPTTNPPPFITPIHIPPKTPYNPNPPPLNTTTTYTFQKTNGSLSLNLISFEMDPIFEVSRLDIYVDLKLSTSLLLVEGTGVDITFENSSEMEIFLLGPNGPVLGVLYFPCEFFVDKKSSVLELDFRNFNYLKIDVTFNKEIKLVRQDAKILYIYNEGHEFEDLYTYTPRICGVCYKFIVLLSYAMRCRRCKFTSHKTCSDWTLFHCKKSIEIDNTQFKKSYDLSHLLNSIFSSGFRYCSHCGDRINTSKKVLQCIKCELRFHEECEINIFNSCGITLDLRKKMAEFIPPIPKNMKPKQKRSISDYQVIRVLGKGNFGKVLLVRERRKGEVSNVIKGKIKVEECGGSDEEGCVEGGNEAGGKGKAGGKGNDNDDYNEDPLFNDHKVNGQRNLVSKDRSFEKEEKKLLKNHKNMHKDTNDPLSINGPHPTNNNPTASHPTNNPPTSHPTSTSPPTLTSHPTTNPPPTPPNQITDLIALKILRKEKIVNISDVAYIEVERKVLELAAYYKHPFLMKMYFCFQDSKALYFGCEYLAGGDLFTHTVRNSFGLKDILLYASEILLALDFLHNKHYIYRDLKLDNILVGEDGHVKICDFGLCKEGIGPLAHTYTYCGTLNTIAPEIIRGEPYTKAVDWWSYGVVLYELYERRPPFTGATSSELSRNILENKPEFSKTPEDAKKLIKKLLCSEPEERYGFGPNGVELIKNHEYFKEINWKDVYEKKISPEFKPGNIHSQFEGNSREETVIASPTTTNCDYDQYFINFK